jgi:GDP-D-mannose 3',5'-epimerase
MNLKGETAVVCGAGGFIGGHLVKSLIANGVNVVRAVDVKPLTEWYQVTEGVENLSLDLKGKENCLVAADGVSVVYQLAADMGGMGFIENNKALWPRRRRALNASFIRPPRAYITERSRPARM